MLSMTMLGKRNIIRWISPLLTRSYIGKQMNKFYKRVTISETDGGYEVNLDKKKLKTPLGNILQIPSEALALAVSAEWNNQGLQIDRNTMNLTSLCNTVIDNPSRRDRNTIINGILEFLATDTVCYRIDEPVELSEKQKSEWDPLLLWIKHRYGVNIEPTSGIGVPSIPEETLHVFRQHLESFNDWALVGYQQAVECIKSFVITSAVVERHITVEHAVQLARLEQEFQISRWGNVDWYHDVDLFEQRKRLASSVLFVHLNIEEEKLVFKKNI